MVKVNDALRIQTLQRQKQLQDLSALEDMFSTENSGNTETQKEGRYIAAPPPNPEKNPRLNPDGIVDVVTFCEHPYYLGQTLYPWQKLTLKSFYAGTDGNRHLKIEDNRHEEGCDGCVWQYNMKSELDHVTALMAKRSGVDVKIPVAKMTPENSPCLNCTRFDEEERIIRFEELLDLAADDEEINDIKRIRLRENFDRYETEMDLLEDKRIAKRVRDQFVSKFGKRFSELVMVMGRRSGKSFMVSIIALYEVYRFLSMGHPQARYPIMATDTITICNVAINLETAKDAIFNKMAELAKQSPFLSKHLGKENTTELCFLTDYDKKENERRAKVGQNPLEGTIQILCGHSKAKGMLGRTMAMVIIDEMAAMARESDEGSDGVDGSLYSLLKPSLATFGKDGRIVCLSNPLGPIGKFYELYEESFDVPSMMMMQLPTILSNPEIDLDLLRTEQEKDPSTFEMQYGAQFAPSGNSPFLPSTLVNMAFERRRFETRQEVGAPLMRYYAHLDPAYSSDNYTLVVVHTEPMMTMPKINGKMQMRVVVDHIHIWEPQGRNHPINVDEVDGYIINLAQRFKFAQISYDHWNSQSSISKLRGVSLPVIMTPFTLTYQDLIFQELYDLFMQQRIEFYGEDTKLMINGTEKNLHDATEAKSQLLKLQKKWRGKHYKIEALAGQLDDICDCVASAAYQSLKDKAYGGLPQVRLARVMPRRMY